MDNINHSSSLPGIGGFSRRVFALQARYQQLFATPPRIRFGRTARRRTFGIALLFTAVLLGIWANGISRKSVLESWYRENYPSQAIWEHALESKSFRAVVRPEELAPFLRSLPLSPDSHHEVWVTEDKRTVVVFEDEPKVYTRAKSGEKHTGSPWMPFGTGWLGFDKVCKDIGLEARLTQLPRSKVIPADPRAIRY